MFPLQDTIQTRSVPFVTWGIILLNAIVFLYELALPPRALEYLVAELGMVPARLGNDPDSWWTLLTCMFLHGGWMHFIGNMWVLYLFGDNVEDRMGPARYLIFYLLCGLAASATPIVASPDSMVPTVGASGASAGVMGAYFVMFPMARVITLVPIFIFPYYEEVLVVRVHPEILQTQRLPDECRERPHFWEERYRDIVQFEDYLNRNGTRIIKVFLHLSKEEQRQRLLSRIEDPEKSWKLSPTDLDPQQHWDAYQHAYEQCLRQTSHKASRWYAVPADDKYSARLIISQIILQHMRKLPVSYPEITKQHRREIVEIRRLLQSGL